MSVAFTIDDVTLRVVEVEVVTLARQIKVVLFDNQGTIVREVVYTRNATSTVSVDLPARLVEGNGKSYVAPTFAVFF